MADVDIWQDEAGEWRWTLKAGNGEVVASGEGHTSHADAERAFLTAQRNMAEATPDDAPHPGADLYPGED